MSFNQLIEPKKLSQDPKQDFKEDIRPVGSNHTYIGLDQALTNTGVAIYRDGSVLLLTLRTDDQEENYYHRLATLKRWVDQLIKKFQPLDFYLEDVYFNRKTSANYIPIEVHAVLKTLLYEYGYNTPSLSSNQNLTLSWPRISGISVKNGAKRILLQRGIKINNHENDALGILFAGMIRSGLMARDQIWEQKITKKLVKSTPILDFD